jgi:hypothetical protein
MVRGGPKLYKKSAKTELSEVRSSVAWARPNVGYESAPAGQVANPNP